MDGFYIAIVSTSALAATMAALGVLGRSWQPARRRDADGAAVSIFDDQEPLGRVTDAFPHRRAGREAAAQR